MKSEIKQCANCKNDFVIEPRDLSFYERIKVPPPSWCPDCRCMRRMVHRNERSLHRRTCDITGKNIISIYRGDCPFTICDKDYVFSDQYNPSLYGVKYNQKAKFFEQFYEFAKKVPLASLYVRNSINCEYNQDMGQWANCYLCFRTHDSQNMLYTYRGNHSSYITDCFQAVAQSEFLYECINVITCSNSKYLQNCEKCSDSAFLYNCTGCVDCFMCNDLRNKQCCYKNKQYSREEYKKIIETYDLSTYTGAQKGLKEFEELLKKYPRKNLSIVRSQNIIGDNIFDSKDCSNVWNARDLENCRNIWDSFNFKDCMDTYSGAKAELIYESTATTKGSSNCHFCVRVHSGSRDCEYSWFLQNCSDCFACIGLSKMIEDKEYGEFFPMHISPFPYNDTVAQEFFPKDEEYAKKLGMKWGEIEERKYKSTIDSSMLPDGINEVEDGVLKESIVCLHKGECDHGCTGAFRIVEDELAYYRRKKIPLPRECPNCRYYRRLSYRNSTKLREITCMCMGENLSNSIYQNTVEHSHGKSACGKVINTTIKEGSESIIYCDECYKREVY